MTTTIQGRIYGSAVVDDSTCPTSVKVRIFAKDPDNPRWLLDAHAYADGPLAQRIATECDHGTMITATGVLTRTTPLPEDEAAGNTAASLALTDATLTP
ncbi:hypothetical protein [Corynebacterium senegalense]|uniref:hypothetical protein n=1 Tax=Corynebacterium senegalense TaxID=2080750 RepID=UPI000E1FD629|nr:hypothetical protein [Corynebacterium senegalense]